MDANPNREWTRKFHHRDTENTENIGIRRLHRFLSGFDRAGKIKPPVRYTASSVADRLMRPKNRNLRNLRNPWISSLCVLCASVVKLKSAVEFSVFHSRPFAVSIRVHSQLLFGTSRAIARRSWSTDAENDGHRRNRSVRRSPQAFKR